MQKQVYLFSEGQGHQKKLLGGKGANLCEMTQLGVPVPPGFVVTTQVCNQYLERDKQFPEGLWSEVQSALADVEQSTGKIFGGQNPLLVSVRSGAPVSMPGMMDTVLNLGLNDQTVEYLAQKTNNPRFAYDSYRRFIQMFANVVLGMGHHFFEDILQSYKRDKQYNEDTDMLADDWAEIIEKYKQAVVEFREGAFPQDPMLQLELAVRAVFNSWLTPRAVKYRQIYNISEDLGTAVNIQAMVFGNTGEMSGTGVLFTRDPSTGENKLFGEYLLNAQGEDVVAGIRTPYPIAELEQPMPAVYADIVAVTEKLEQHFGDMQDIEFTIEEQQLYILQTRNGKRSAMASLQIAVEMFQAGLISQEKALMQIDPQGLDQLLHPRIKAGQDLRILTSALPASPGAAVGQVVFDSETAEDWAKDGKKVILVRHETSPEDVNGMHVSEGILTACGGMTSHAAVVARGMGKPCVSGASEVVIYEAEKRAVIGENEVQEGDWLTLDGAAGDVIMGQVKTEPAEISEKLKVVLGWAESIATMRVRTNADTPADAAKAREFGAQGIGLCRTEHMFFDEGRIGVMQEMILADSAEQRQTALNRLLPFQVEDFTGIFTAMDGYPVTVRLLDPPLHEFLPTEARGIELLATQMQLPVEHIQERVQQLHEVNPMLGHRGCRLMVTYPEMVRMQTRGIMMAALAATKNGIDVQPEIMVPLVGMASELREIRAIIESEIAEVFTETGQSLPYVVGTMIEVPRACLIADEVAQHADFFSFGTNDLTQMTFGFSRDDVGKFLPTYLDHKYLFQDPFQVLDQEGVGKLIRIAVDKGRQTNPDLKIGICGEHGGEPSSIDFCFHQDFNYVSCSPYRVAIARIATAQSYIRKWL